MWVELYFLCILGHFCVNKIKYASIPLNLPNSKKYNSNLPKGIYPLPQYFLGIYFKLPPKNVASTRMYHYGMQSAWSHFYFISIPNMALSNDDAESLKNSHNYHEVF